MAEALYRKYRPQIFEDVVGQEHIERTIKNAIEQDKVSHAYLFTGPRGTGKTTTARLLAKALLCERGPTAEPDGTCADCEMIAAGEHPDVYELDAASRTGVENVREEIIGRVQFAPTRGRYKIYIIDEVHMLSTAAFNALLKTLEEPPSHVVFILATTDPQKVPETIHSRCQRFDFRRISSEAIVSRLGAICVAEDVEFEGEALDLIAHRAEGGMRNALTSLEQLIAFGEGKVTMEVAERMLGSLDVSELAEIVRFVGTRDVASCFRWTAEYVETGADLAQFTRDFAEHIRNMYVMSLTGADVALDVSESVRRELAEELPLFGPDRLARLLAVLGDLSAELKTSTNPRLSFEIALTRMVRPDSDLTLASLAERVEALESGYSAVSAELKTSTNPRLSFEIALTRMVRPDSDLTLASLAERVEALESGYSAVAHVMSAPAGAGAAGAMGTAGAPAGAGASRETIGAAAGAAAVTGGAPDAASARSGGAEMPTGRPGDGAAVPGVSDAAAGMPGDVSRETSAGEGAGMGAGASAAGSAGVAGGQPADAGAASADAAGVAAPAAGAGMTGAPNVGAAGAGAAEPAAPASAVAAGGTAAAGGPLPDALLQSLRNPASLQRMWQAVLSALTKAKTAYGVLFLNTKAVFDEASGTLAVEFLPENDFAFKTAQGAGVQEELGRAIAQACGAALPFMIVKGGARGASAGATPMAAAVAAATASMASQAAVGAPSGAAGAGAQGTVGAPASAAGAGAFVPPDPARGHHGIDTMTGASERPGAAERGYGVAYDEVPVDLYDEVPYDDDGYGAYDAPPASPTPATTPANAGASASTSAASGADVPPWEVVPAASGAFASGAPATAQQNVSRETFVPPTQGSATPGASAASATGGAPAPAPGEEPSPEDLNAMLAFGFGEGVSFTEE